MPTPLTAAAKLLLTLLVALAWFALAGQFFISINSGAASKFELFIRYFSFFTILTNLLVAICSTSLLFFPNSAWGHFFARPGVQTAITVYIVIVGLVYNTILRYLWSPQGLQQVIDEILHSIIPVMFFLYWLIFVPKRQLRWKQVPLWLIYPFAYLIYVTLRGLISDFYPYPFIHLRDLGINKMITNSIGMAFLFVLVSCFFVGIGKIMTKRL